ncbi:MAG: DNA polymerase III subunit epsilon [Rhodospirillales bacterium]|nr:DNA polymerase III subunit epsilon [Rhodospirillales bacterium]
MREIVLDTETTGLDPKSGHRIVEIGCVELVNHVPTSRTYHQYINPERDMPAEAFRVHGLSVEFLGEHPVFAEIVDAFVEFVDGATLIIHNAEFDMGFINAELGKLDRPRLAMESTIDTVRMARKKFPGAPANLDSLCKRFGIDNSNRELHGALLDARLLADVYLELIGGRQTDLGFSGDRNRADGGEVDSTSVARAPRAHSPSPEEEARHRAFLTKLSSPLWLADDPAS